MIGIRPGIGRLNATLLALWCLPWAIGMGWALKHGKFRWDGGPHAGVEYITRTSNPIFYWTVLTIITAMIVFIIGYTFTFGGSSHDSTEDDS